MSNSEKFRYSRKMYQIYKSCAEYEKISEMKYYEISRKPLQIFWGYGNMKTFKERGFSFNSLYPLKGGNPNP